MRKETVKDLSLEGFSAYGSFASMIDPDTVKIGAEPIEFFRDMVRLNLGTDSTALFSVCRVTDRPLVVDLTEFHSHTGEGILPLDGDVVIHVGPATPTGEVPVDRIEAFRVPKGTFVSIHPGVWHYAPFAAGSDCVNVLIVLPERTYANDCYVYEIPEDQRTEIEGV